MRYVAIACGCLLAAVLVVALGGKAWRPAAFRAFADALVTLRLTGTGSRYALASAVAVAEAAVVVLLLGTAWAPIGFAAAVGLFGVLTAGVAVSLSRGAATPCPCFGAASRPVGPPTLVRNGMLIVVATLGLCAALAGSGPIRGTGVALAVTAGLVGAVLVIQFDDVVDLFWPASGRRTSYPR